MSNRPHGYARYRLDGGRCDICVAAVSEYNKIRSAGLADGTWQPFTSAEATVEHIRSLYAAGMSDRQIAVAAGVSHRRVYSLRTTADPALIKVRPATEAAILSVVRS
jgi:hypothetical protein